MSINDYHNNVNNQHPIRFGIMCDGTILEEWQALCLKNLMALDNVQLALVIINDDSKTMFEKIKEIHPNRIFFQLFMKFFIRPRSTRRVNMTNFLSKFPSVRCKTIKKGKFSQYFSREDIQTIRGYDLDFILRFGFGIIRGEILKAARYGIWSFHHDDEEKYRGTPPCFWEIYNNDKVTGAMLQRITDKLDAGVVLKKGFFKTVNYSYARNIDTAYFESTRWPAQVCIDIINGNADYLNAPPSKTKAPIFRPPNNLQMLLFLIKILRNFIAEAFNLIFRHEQWNIGIVYKSIHSFLKPEFKPKIRYIPHKKSNNFLADPFGIIKNKRLTILCENFDYQSSKGNISSIKLTGKAFSQPKVAIDSSVHMSYPYLFRHRGKIYCIPETSQAEEICLYEAKKFPYRWSKVATLIKNVPAIDPTIFRYKGIWWLTFTDKSSHNLFIWYAHNLLGPWKSHANNPVKTDIRSTRPAGTPFIHNNYLYRPAQDCSKTYGGRIVVNRVIKLSPAEFKEEQVAVIEPYKDSPYPDGLHTLSAVGNITLIDGKRFMFIKDAFKNSLIKGFKKMFNYFTRKYGWDTHRYKQTFKF
jgi:hypothetical protein